jgi:hypothetical protein
LVESSKKVRGPKTGYFAEMMMMMMMMMILQSVEQAERKVFVRNPHSLEESLEI